LFSSVIANALIPEAIRPQTSAFYHSILFNRDGAANTDIQAIAALVAFIIHEGLPFVIKQGLSLTKLHADTATYTFSRINFNTQVDCTLNISGLFEF
jgi:hypothetical protein